MENTHSEDALMETRTVPANFGPSRGASGNARLTGPCGDTMEFWLIIVDDQIVYASYTTDGCHHSIVCGSAAAQLIIGIPLHMVMQLGQKNILAKVEEEIPEESQHCALLSINTVKEAIKDYLKRHEQQNRSHACAASSQQNTRKEDKGSKKEDTKLESRLSKIEKKIVVLSGKGGVGKSTVAVNLAMSLVKKGKKVGILDVDIHGPSIPTMLGLVHESLQTSDGALMPIKRGNLSIMSIGFLLQDPDEAIIWRGPKKVSAIRQFIEDVNWGDLDYLVVDCPPGTGDEPLSVCQLLGEIDGAIIVTTPQEVALTDVRKSISFCRSLNLPILGVVENMSGFACSGCGLTTEIFSTGGGKRLAEASDISYIGRIPIDPSVGVSGDDGTPFIVRFEKSSTAQFFAPIAEIALNL